MARHEKTTLEKQYDRERKRIKSFISNASKRGYIFRETLVPPKPKKITEASVRRLKKITPDYLYKKGEYVSFQTGEVISARKARSLERKESALKASVTRAEKNLIKAQQSAKRNEELHEEYYNWRSRESGYEKTLAKAQKKQDKTLRQYNKAVDKLQKFQDTNENLNIQESSAPINWDREPAKKKKQSTKPTTSVVDDSSTFEEHQRHQREQDEDYEEQHPEERTFNGKVYDSIEQMHDSPEYQDYYRTQMYQDYDDNEWTDADEAAYQRYVQRRKEKLGLYTDSDSSTYTIEEASEDFNRILQAINNADPHNSGAGEILRNELRDRIDKHGLKSTMKDASLVSEDTWKKVELNPVYSYSGADRASVYRELYSIITGLVPDAATSRALVEAGEKYDTENTELKAEDSPNVTENTNGRVTKTNVESDYNPRSEAKALLKQDAGRIYDDVMEGLEDTTWYNSLSDTDKAIFQVDKATSAQNPDIALNYIEKNQNYISNNGIDWDSDFQDEQYELEEAKENISNFDKQ